MFCHAPLLTELKYVLPKDGRGNRSRRRPSPRQEERTRKPMTIRSRFIATIKAEKLTDQADQRDDEKENYYP